jgi:chorismate lyase/3-hydroxybenzoate synthase
MEVSCPLTLPPWAERLAPRPGPLRSSDDRIAAVCVGEGYALVSAVIRDADVLAAPELRRATSEAYEAIGDELAGTMAPNPVRMWNFLPGILEPLEPFSHRYMAFNAGRHDALSGRYQSTEAMADRLPTATGVGHDGRDLLVHCLAAEQPGRGITNPRQTDAFRYSTEFGPAPPVFSRATRIDDACPPSLLVGGTASVLGERTAHANDLAGQLDETLRNIDALIETARWKESGTSEVRVYFPHARDEDFLREEMPRRLPGAAFEFLRADLCRPDLLVEIEARLIRP